jgi:copper chaperone CopZ
LVPTEGVGARSEPDFKEETMERVRLTIEGMSCGHCVRGVDQALRSLPGVEVEKVEIGSAVVAYDSAVVKPEQLTEAISEEGYEVRGVGRAT